MLIDDGRVVSNFIIQALRGEPLSIYGNGSQTRSFCYVDDLIDGIVKLMESECTGPINLGNPKEFTIRQLAELVLKKINPELHFIEKVLPLDDPKQRRPLIDLAQHKLGWQPSISLEEGLDPTIEFFRSILETNEFKVKGK